MGFYEFALGSRRLFVGLRVKLDPRFHILSFPFITNLDCKFRFQIYIPSVTSKAPPDRNTQ